MSQAAGVHKSGHMYNVRVAAQLHTMLTTAVLVQLFKRRHHAPRMVRVALARMYITQSWLLSSFTVILSNPTVDNDGFKVRRCPANSSGAYRRFEACSPQGVVQGLTQMSKHTEQVISCSSCLMHANLQKQRKASEPLCVTAVVQAKAYIWL